MDPALYKQLIGIAAVLICFIQYVPMLYLTLAGRKQPHAFTRLIWGLCLGITFVAQWLNQGGAGAWPTGVSCAFCIAISLAAFRNGKSYISRFDWVCFIGALLAIPLWLVSHDPLSAVVWAAVIDLLGYMPTIRKSWHRPNDELLSGFTLGCLKQFLSITAMEDVSATNVVYPVATLAFDLTFIAMVVMRRSSLRKDRGEMSQ